MIETLGYKQAIQNLAFYIRDMADRTQSPVFDANPWLIEEDPDFQVDFCSEHMSEQDIHDWSQLDTAFEAIVTTYRMDPDTVYAQVFAQIMAYDLQAGTFLAS